MHGLLCFFTAPPSPSPIALLVFGSSSILLRLQILQYGRVMRPSLGVVIAPPQALQRIGEKGVLVLDVSGVL